MDQARLFLMVCSDRTKNNGLKFEHRKFHTNMKKNSFMVWVMELWNRLPREVVECPSMEILKTQLNTFLCNLCGVPTLARGLDLMISCGPFQPLQLCASVIS